MAADLGQPPSGNPKWRIPSLGPWQPPALRDLVPCLPGFLGSEGFLPWGLFSLFHGKTLSLEVYLVQNASMTVATGTINGK